MKSFRWVCIAAQWRVFDGYALQLMLKEFNGREVDINLRISKRQPWENSTFNCTSLLIAMLLSVLSSPAGWTAGEKHEPMQLQSARPPLPALRIPRPPRVQNRILVGGALCPQRERRSLALPSDWSNIHILRPLSGPEVTRRGWDGRNWGVKGEVLTLLQQKAHTHGQIQVFSRMW